MKDWMVRALKTFVQSFFGVLVPEVVLILSGGLPESVSAAWSILSPIVAAALAAAISAVWNIAKPPVAATPATVPETLEAQIRARLTPEQRRQLMEALRCVEGAEDV